MLFTRCALTAAVLAAGCASVIMKTRVSGGIIEGTFHTEGNEIPHMPPDGRWRVKRAAP